MLMDKARGHEVVTVDLMEQILEESGFVGRSLEEKRGTPVNDSYLGWEYGGSKKRYSERVENVETSTL